ncbi:MAG: ribonuclease E/G [Coprococcus sp.]
MDKLVVTRNENKILQAYYENNRLMELSLTNAESELYNIYIGKVENVVNNINACFIDYGGEKTCYYSLEENKHIFMNSKKTDEVKAGDELLIQISRDAVKTKNPVASSELSLCGEYCIVNLSTKIGISNKITSAKRREELKKIAAGILPDGMGCIIRTNAAEGNDEQLIMEMNKLAGELAGILKKAGSRTCYSCLYKKDPDYMDSFFIKNKSKINEIVTDDEKIYKDFFEYISFHQLENIELRMYDDQICPLMTTYNLKKELENVTKEKVWMKSGAYLVIQQTEAMVVVDVNTGKSITNKNIEQHMLSVNKEAAIETCRQMRLRNLSGIIMIDFINMRNVSDMDEIRDVLINELKKDSVPAQFVDVTKLGLVELTRKKIRKPIAEMLGD